MSHHINISVMQERE